MKTVIASGYMNPLHVGHLAYLEAARALGDSLIVIVNSDAQVKLKGRIPFMNEEDRMNIVGALRCVDEVVLSIDTDRTVRDTLRMIADRIDGPIIFANGGDATRETVPEVDVCEDLGIELAFGVGGGKIAASSGFLKKVAV